MKDTIIVKGEVNIQVYENDILKETFHENNLVVTLGKTNVAKLLAGDVNGKPITKFAVGTSNTLTTVDDTTITNPFSKAISDVSFPDAQRVLFSFELEKTEANGLAIREFGLLNSSDVLFARKVRDAEILKTDIIRLVGTWEIKIN